MVGKVILAVVLVALIAAVTVLAVKLERQTSINTLGGEAYSIGTLDETGKYAEGDTSIYTSKAITTDGLTCKLADDAKIKYQLFYYDEKGEFLSKSDELTADFDGKTIPEGAKSVKIMITPTEDEDGKVGALEVLGYAAQLTVRFNK